MPVKTILRYVAVSLLFAPYKVQSQMNYFHRHHEKSEYDEDIHVPGDVKTLFERPGYDK